MAHDALTCVSHVPDYSKFVQSDTVGSWCETWSHVPCPQGHHNMMAAYAWCDLHVSDAWTVRRANQGYDVCFSNPDHAVQFALLFGHTT